MRSTKIMPRLAASGACVEASDSALAGQCGWIGGSGGRCGASAQAVVAHALVGAAIDDRARLTLLDVLGHHTHLRDRRAGSAAASRVLWCVGGRSVHERHVHAAVLVGMIG
jgi:hypothetical protein